MKLFKKIKDILTMTSGREGSLLEKYKIGEDVEESKNKEETVTETNNSFALKSRSQSPNLGTKIEVSKEGLKVARYSKEQVRLNQIMNRTKNRRIKNKLQKRIDSMQSDVLRISTVDNNIYLYGIDLASGSDKTSYYFTKDSQ